MIPVLFKLGPITLYSFGLMLGIAFLVANYLLILELRRKNLGEELSGNITLIALVGGVLGSKLFSLLENWKAVVKDPMGEIFSASGLTFYGGLIVATLAIYVYIRRKGIPFLKVADAASPSLIIAYGIGRIGCLLSGDGDYGIPSRLPWAMTFPDGTVPTYGLRLHNTPQGGVDTVATGLGELYRTMYGSPIPEQVPVHPTPLYETLATVAIFALLWNLRTRPRAAGWLFGVYLIMAGIERMMVEFIRLNPLYLGLSQAQWISIGMMILGAYFIKRAGSLPVVEEPPARATRRTRPSRS